MADDQNQDKSQKTEEATPPRLEEARKKGQIPVSREVGHMITILFLGVFVAVMSTHTLFEALKVLRPFLEFSSEIITSPKPLQQTILILIQDLTKIVLWPIVLLAAMLLISSGVQTRFVLALEKVKPKLSNMSPLAGIKRLFSMKSIIEFLKSLVKMVIVISIVSAILIPRFYEIDDFQLLSLQQLLQVVKSHMSLLFFIMLTITFVLAAGDYMIQRFQTMKELRMSHQDIKEEQKDLEGDPHIKSKLREIRRKRSKENMAKAVPTADVIITNPTHYSIALQYDPDKMDAPKVVAKGVDFMALKIRELGRGNRIPLVENAPLARALYQTVEVDEEIPEQFYKAVARIIRYIMDLKADKNTAAL